MSLRQYREHRTGEQDGSQVLDRNHHEVARDQLVPRIIKRNRQAVLTDPHWFYFFQRKRTGRRCSCFRVETSPDGLCQVCFGTGIVGGYVKFGTTDEWFDSSYPGIRSVNVIQNFADATRPVMLTLNSQALVGFIEFPWQIRPSIRQVDLFQVVARNLGTTRSTVRASIRGPLESDFVPLTNSSIQERLCRHTATLRVTFERQALTDPPPLLSHLYVRYCLCPETRVQMDIPRVSESITLAEYGVFDSFTTLSGWITDEVKVVGTEDFFKRTEDGTLWKTIESQPNRPLLQNTSHDLQLRLINSFEQRYHRYPTG
jgi:hypothetical protein